MRYWCLFLFVVFGTAHAAEISGTVSSPVRGAQIKVGYEALTRSGEQITNMAGLTVGDGAASVSCTTWKPRITSLTWDTKNGLSFRHSVVPPGRYLIYAKAGDTYLVCKTVDVPSDSAKVKVALDLNLSAAGQVHIKIRKGKGDYEVSLQPLSSKKTPHIPGLDLGRSFSLRIEKELTMQDSAAFDKVSPGFYQLVLKSAKRTGTLETGQVSTFTDLGSWVIEVRPRYIARYTVP